MKLKDNIYTGDYVKCCNDKRRRSLLVQLRLGILPLNSGISRFSLKKELVIFCNTHVEDEFHFVCVCEEYTQFREIVYPKVINVEFIVVTEDQMCVYLINNYCKELSIYIEKAWHNLFYINKDLPYIVISSLT